MDWLSIGAAALAGALAGLVAAFVRRKSKLNRTVVALAFVLCFVLFSVLAKEFVVPRVRAWRTEQALLDIPVYRLVKEGDPVTYEKLKSSMVISVQRGERREQVVNALRSVFVPTIPKYIPIASDESIVHYMDVLVKEMEMLLAEDASLCYQFLFPQPNVFLDLSRHLSSDLQKADMDALAEVIRSAIKSPQARPDGKVGQELLGKVARDMTVEYGEDVSLLKKAQEPTADKAKVCALTLSLYKKAIALPSQENGVLLRYLLAAP